MLLVIPFHSADRGQVERLGKWMSALSKGKRIGPKLLFAATQNTEIKGIGDYFKGLFDEMQAIKQTFGPSLQPGEPAWPKACNFQFLHVTKYIHENYSDIDSFYYFEPDNLPLTPDWFDRIQEDYDKQEKPFYGVSASYVMRADGSSWADGEHMIGTGVYPKNAWNRVKGYEKMEREQPGRPWDAITRDEVNPMCHFTNLIAHVHNSRGFREDGLELTAIYRPNLVPEFARRPVDISNEAVVLHGCKDSSLRLFMAKQLGIPQLDTLTFAHAGDLGDVIWALPSIRALGGGILKFSPKGYAREPMTQMRVNLISPLLMEQPYIKDVQIHDEGYVDFDFRQFRTLHKQHSNLSRDQAEWTGAKIDTSGPWLTLPPCKATGHIIINRTDRYRNELFPWATLHRSLGDHLRFVGLPKEHEDFETDFGTVPYLPTETLLDVALLIKGSRNFIGNQSVCNAIAEALKHPRSQETCLEAQDCIYDGENATYCLDGKLTIPVVETRSKDLDFILKDPHFLKCIRMLVREIIEEELK